jgi:peptide/nickel transport system permease protein
MTTFIIRRLIEGFVVIIAVSLIIFLMMRLLPGDPLSVYIAQNELSNMPKEMVHQLEIQFGLDKPLMVQYFGWIGDALRGNLGTSIFYQQNVTALILQRMPITIHLGILAFILSSILGIILGVLCALKRGTWIDSTLTILANIGITLPSFWIAILLIYVFGLQLKLLPVFGYTSPFQDFGLNTKEVIMPVFCLAVFSIAGLTRQCRSTVLEVVRQDYIRTAWAKGLNERVVVLRHILKNALIPVVTVLGLQIRLIFGGSVIIETVFNINGIGKLLTSAVFSQDYQVVQAGTLVIAVIVVLSNLLVDISYSWLDPRIRME